MKELLSFVLVLFIVNCSAQNYYEKSIINGKDTWVLHFKQDLKPVRHITDPIQNIINNIKSDTKAITDNWQRLYPGITDGFLNSIETTGDTIIAAGSEGDFQNLIPVVIISTNNGESWNKFNISTEYVLFDLQFHGNVLYGLGIDFTTNNYIGTFSKSTDLGKTWTLLKKENDFSYFHSMDIYGDNIFLSIAHLGLYIPCSIDIIYSTDAGITWDTNPFTVNTWMIVEIFVSFVDANNGWLSYHDNTTHIYHTTNKGIDWVEQFTEPIWIKALAAVDDRTIYFMKYYDPDTTYSIFKSSDAGASWHNIKEWSGSYTKGIFSCTDDKKLMVNLFYTDMNRFYLNNNVTVDGGLSWMSSNNRIPDDLFYCQKFTGQDCWIAGDIGNVFCKEGSNPLVSKIPKISSYSISGISYLNENNAFACDRGGTIFKSSDGKNFSDVYSDYSMMFNDICAVNQNTIIATGNHHMSPSQILRSTNSGTSWSKMDFDSLDVKKIYFKDSNNGWITASHDFVYGFNFPLLLKTTDGGASWDKVHCSTLISTVTDINNILFTNNTEGWIIGRNGVIMRTSDDGTNWQLEWGNLDPNAFWIRVNLLGIKTFSEEKIFISGIMREGMEQYDILLKTSNKGVTWDTLRLGAHNSDMIDKMSIYFLNASQGWIFGSEVYKTNDGGASWSQISTIKNIEAYSAFDKYIWASGVGGSLYKYTNSVLDVDNLSPSVPGDFGLYQNYPNPFNPSTIIQYDLPEAGRVEISVFDILGHEVKTLVNETKQQGRYAINFDASDLASGLYIYRIITGSFTASKKMLYLK